MSPAAVELNSPNETFIIPNFSVFFPETDQRSMNPGVANGIHFGFGPGSVHNTKTRTKPRLVKLRKNTQKAGFNPFTTPSNGRNDADVDKAFVFGATSVDKVLVTPVSYDDDEEEEFSTPIGSYDSGSESTKERSDKGLRSESRKEHSDKGLGSESTKERSYKGLGSESTKERSYKGLGSESRKEHSDKGLGKKCNENGSGKDVDDSELKLRAEMRKLNIGRKSENVVPSFIFGSSGKVDGKCNGGGVTSGTWSFSSNSGTNGHGGKGYAPSFIFGSSRKVDAKSNGAGSWSFSSNGGDKRPFHSETTSTSSAFGEFKVPQWDPSSFKNSLFPELSRNQGYTRRNRLFKDRRSTKVKEVVKPQASEGVESKEQLSSPGYSSPMDFSPYNGEKASGGFPTGPPLTSVDPSQSRGHVNPGSSNGFKVASAKDPSVVTAEGHGSTFMPIFSFSASASQEKKTRHAVKKYRRKVNNIFQKNNQENQPVNTGQAKQESGSTSVMPNVCEVWRLRGNQAYKNGDMRKAEDCYTYGINSSPSSASSEYSVKPLALCYGNRAAARISIGRLREAISDCEIAASLDPSYIKAHMRVANCHLVLGELESAVRYFNKCMESASSVCLDRRTTIESAEGLQQAQKVADYTSCASVFLENRTPDGASDALVSIANALLISSCSDKLLHMKAEALLMLRHYNKVIELCENTLQTAERNFVSAGNVDQLGSKHHSPRVWRWNLISKSHFYLGNLETALDILEKLQQAGSSRNENQEECRDSPSSLMATISELIRYKNAGNEAVRAGKYMEAVEQYTGALSKNVDSRPFAAICFCNRAAANQALIQIADAISDCSLAMALDENYSKAVSRRATLHEMIRDYDQAASDLQRLVDILVKQNNEKTKTPDTSADRSTSRKELKQARQRLSLMEEKSKEGIPLDFFLIMGVKASDTAADIKKAYRKAALRHHPDKAAKILVRSESEGPWLKEILEEVHKGADRLFKTIGEAYSVLSDPTKRSDYELDEEVRKARAARESYRSRENRRSAESTSSPFQTSSSGRYGRDSGRTYRNTPSWW